MYRKIYNLETNRWVNINGKIGKRILKNYINQQGGSNGHIYQQELKKQYNESKIQIAERKFNKAVSPQDDQLAGFDHNPNNELEDYIHFNVNRFWAEKIIRNGGLAIIRKTSRANRQNNVKLFALSLKKNSSTRVIHSIVKYTPFKDTSENETNYITGYWSINVDGRIRNFRGLSKLAEYLHKNIGVRLEKISENYLALWDIENEK